MKNNIELVEKIKNGDTKSEEFIKNNLLKKIEQTNINNKEEFINNVFDEGLKLYNDTIPIPFCFYLINILQKRISNDSTIISFEEQKIIKLYLNKENNRYLTNHEIANKLNISIDKVKQTINKFNDIAMKENNNSYLEKIIPNCLEKIKKRTEHFNTNNSISNEQIKLIAYYIGEITGYPTSISKLKDIYKNDNIIEDLKVSFNLLKNNKNLNRFLKDYPNAKRNLLIKAKQLDIELNNIKLNKSLQEYGFTHIQIKIINSLYQHRYDALTDEEIANLLDLQPIYYKGEKTKLFNLIRKNKELQKVIYTKYNGFNILKNDKNLSDEQIKLIKSYKELKENTENYEEILSNGGYKNLHEFYNDLDILYKYLKKNIYLLNRVLKIYPNFNLNEKLLTVNEAKTLEILVEANKKYISLEKAAKNLGYYNENINYFSTKFRLIKDVLKNRSLTTIISKIYKDLTISRNDVPNEREKEMLNLLHIHNDNPLTDEEMAIILEYKNVEAYTVAKTKLFKKAQSNKKLLLYIQKIYKEFDLNSLTSLTTKEKQIIEYLNNNDSKNDSESFKELGYSSLRYYQLEKNKLLKKVGDNPELYKNIKKIYPNFYLEYSSKLRPREIELLIVLNKQLSDEETRIILNYKNVESFKNAKKALYQRLINNWKLEIEAKKYYPTIDLKKDSTKKLNLKENPIIKDSNIHNLSIIKDNKLSQAINNFENDFSKYLDGYTLDDKILLTLMLDYYGNTKLSSKDVSTILNISEDYIIEFTNSFLTSIKDNLQEKELKKYFKS